MKLNPVRFPAAAFVSALSRYCPANGINAWSTADPGAEIRRQRLINHLYRFNPTIILVPEAARSMDALRTGLVWCDARTLVSGYSPDSDIEASIGADDQDDPLILETWKSLARLGVASRAVSFPVVPWIPASTRSLTPDDYEQASIWLRSFVDWYPGALVVALGAKTSGILRNLAIDHVTIRLSQLSPASVLEQLKSVLSDFAIGDQTEAISKA